MNALELKKQKAAAKKYKKDYDELKEKYDEEKKKWDAEHAEALRNKVPLKPFSTLEFDYLVILLNCALYLGACRSPGARKVETQR